ncbi:MULTISPECIES: hypothetical protein [unclassified Microcoleus]|uniref:hypothetical protein n=1 Tax=unclassified Microcoleus TaxID=2642155 RepID=UPI0025EA272E|nr:MULTISPECIES: hypothetical protein [unclassified Microcoleus]
MNLKQNFQNQIAEELFPGNLTEDKACFIRRFAPENHPKNRESTHKEIAELMKNDLGVYCENKISQTIRKVIEVIDQKYGEEMKADGVNTEVLLNLKQGGKKDKESEQKISPWQEVYKWLWNDKFLKWLEKNGWQILQEKAKSPDNWLQFLTEEEMTAVQVNRGLVRQTPPPSVQKITLTIPANQSLWMEINLESLERYNYQLLLLNRSKDGQCLLCPSSCYAPNSIMEKRVSWFPQKDSWADYNKQNFMFGEAGNEEFLAIALEKPLSLPWLTPHQEEEFPEWNAERIKELFEQLEQQGNWQVFYQSFEVVEKQ